MKYAAVVFASLIAVAGPAIAGSPEMVHTQNPPVVGSRNVATADPAVPRPGTQPCAVQLFPKQRFGKQGNDARMDATPHSFHYSPPPGCTGPWAKVVLEASFSVDAGHQYDRTASIWLNDVNLYFGTTEEPSPGTTRSWKIQRDLTDYSSLLRSAGTGQVQINNWIGPVFSSAIYASARLLFYPADKAFPAPVAPDQIYALNGKDNTPAKLDKTNEQLSRSVVFPRNTTRVYLDLFAQPQAHDEFYYVCLDDKVIQQVGRPGSNGSLDRAQTCGGGSFREVMVRIDGQAAGLAPVTPWVYTGGLDPFLWQPTPGAETLNFVPYRVDLTPFAGVLSDGKPHTVSVQVLDNPNFFSVAAALLVYQDQHTGHTGGGVTRNTLQTARLNPSMTDTLARGTYGVSGSVFTRAHRHYVIAGYVNTPKGRVQSQVETTLGFENTQRFLSESNHRRRHVSWQTASVDSTSSSSGAGIRPSSLREVIHYTLDVHTLSSRGQGRQLHRAVQARQRFERRIQEQEEGLPLYLSNMSNSHIGAGRLAFERGQRESYQSSDQSSTQNFRFSDSLGDCYQAEVQARDRKVVSDAHGQGCLQRGAMRWFVHPDGSPDSFGWRGIANPSHGAATS